MVHGDDQGDAELRSCARCTPSAQALFFARGTDKQFMECCSSDECRSEWHRRAVWRCCFINCIGGEDVVEIAERLAESMLGILPPCLGGDVCDWERGDESETMVHNMVSTSVVTGSEMPINLSQLAMLLPCSTYDRKRFAAITIRIDNPRCTALLFTSGKLVITGVKSCRLFVHAKYHIINCDVQNIVAHSEIKLQPGQILNIQQMYESMAMECTYQRNMFPGLIYRGKGAPVVLLCFYSGKVVLTGGKTIRDIQWGWSMLWKVVRKFVQ